ncbi:MAG: hypothetical protein N2167_04425 [Flavobacteriales bacterium]|nr:hypothetical protein [Flavobacteriales bacterium]
MKIKLSIIVFVLILSNVFAQEIINPVLTIKSGIRLIYQVDNRGKVYDFIVNITEANKNGIKFNWEMTAPVNFTGKITLTAQALAKANSLFNYFQNNSDETLSNQTTVFLSYDVYKKVIKRKKCTLDFGSRTTVGSSDVLLDSSKKKFSVKINGVSSEIECPVLYAADNSSLRIAFLKVDDFVLIVEMQGDFIIYLKEVTN